MDWNPDMSTAPKDGTHILLYLPWIDEVHEGYWSERGRTGWRAWFHASVSGTVILSSEPTHWQPLPAPPTDKPGEG
jgi:hypothetical protein